MELAPIPFLGFSDPISSLTHLGAALAALVATVPLLKNGTGNVPRFIALTVYSFTMVFLFSMSGVFHLLERGGEARDVFQRLDHAGIWALIAGTFTPVHVILFRGPWRWPILIFVWSLAITGLVLEVIFFTSFPEWLLLSFFLGLGWIVASSGFQFYRAFRDKSVFLLVMGGVFYSLGAVIDFARWPNIIDGVLGPHECFHILIVAAAAAHWLFIYKWSSHPVSDSITFHFRIFPNRRVLADAIDEAIVFEGESVEHAKQLTVDYVRRKFHISVKPKVTIKYVQEESVDLELAEAANLTSKSGPH